MRLDLHSYRESVFQHFTRIQRQAQRGGPEECSDFKDPFRSNRFCGSNQQKSFEKGYPPIPRRLGIGILTSLSIPTALVRVKSL